MGWLEGGGAVYVRHRLDVSLGDVLSGAVACAGAWGRDRLAARTLGPCGVGGDGIVCLSVRTGWDLWLGASGLRGGDEVLMSAVTHPEMARIARLRGLRVVPVDLDQETLAPRPEDLEAALTSRTRAVLVAHLFGGRVDLAPISRFCRAHGLSLVEDCAQAFAGPDEMGHPDADVSMYSFGTLKTATAFGGAVLRVRDGEVLGRMRATEAGYPVQGRFEYAGKLFKGLLLVVASRPRVYGVLIRACSRFGLDLDGLVDLATKSHPAGVAGGELLRRLRRRPCAPLLSLLRRRLERFDPDRIAARTAAGERLSDALGPCVVRPGAGQIGGTYWIFPVVVHESDELVADLRRRGFDASRATSSIVALRPPDGVPEAREAAAMMSGTVFLPAPIGLPEKEIRRLASAVGELAVPQPAVGRLPA